MTARLDVAFGVSLRARRPLRRRLPVTARHFLTVNSMESEDKPRTPLASIANQCSQTSRGISWFMAQKCSSVAAICRWESGFFASVIGGPSGTLVRISQL